jgi:hypothetical protein
MSRASKVTDAARKPMDFEALIDQQIQLLFQSRSVFPHMPADAVGKSSFVTGSFYRERGHDASINFVRPISERERAKWNSIGHWINQNFVVRLWAILDESGQVANIDKNVDGADEVDIIRRLRHRYGHTSGVCNPSDPDHKKLRDRIIDHFELNGADFAEEDFPTPIDKVLVPLAEGAKRYLAAKLPRV